MGESSKIEWTDHTFNPWWGCTEVSPGCDHCYAKREAERYGHHVWGPDVPRRELTEHYWEQPHKWNRKAQDAGERRAVFCGSHCDVMEAGVYLQRIRVARLYPLIAATFNLDWLLLTKRPQNFRKFLPADWIEAPRRNVCGMTSIESAEYLWRAETLAATPFVSRGLSMEPLLGPVIIPVETLSRLDWVIVGGESGPGARPMHPAWVRSIRDQCVAAAVPFFFKQWGEFQNGSTLGERPSADFVVLNDGRFQACADDFDAETRNRWPHFEPTMMARVGKHAAGAVLDGREWRQGPL